MCLIFEKNEPLMFRSIGYFLHFLTIKKCISLFFNTVYHRRFGFVTTIVSSICFVFVSFVFLLTVPVNIFSVMSGRSQRFLGITSTFGV